MKKENSVVFLILLLCSFSVVSAEIKFWVHPNQHGNAEWYKVQKGGNVLNGRLDYSYGVSSRWSLLMQRIKNQQGGFGVYAGQISQTNSDFFEMLKQNNIPISVEMPGFTQCMDGNDVARAELYGNNAVDYSGRHFYSDIYKTATKNQISNGGWFYTLDNELFVPYEISHDHHSVGLLGVIDPGEFYSPESVNLPFNERIKKSYSSLPCRVNHAQGESLKPYEERLNLLLNDYVEYSRQLAAWSRTKGVATPKFSLHWNVNPGWEWSDESCLKQRLVEGMTKFELQQLTRACYNSVDYLESLLVRMCRDDSGAQCPHAVYFDVDWNYSEPYALETLRRHRQSLNDIANEHGYRIKYGINLVDPCDAKVVRSESDGSYVEKGFNCVATNPSGIVIDLGNEAVTGGFSEKQWSNKLHKRSMENMIAYIKNNGVIDVNNSHHILRVQSWSGRPEEVNAEIDERIEGSFANYSLSALNKLYGEYIPVLPITIAGFDYAISGKNGDIRWHWRDNKPAYSYVPINTAGYPGFVNYINYEGRGEWQRDAINYWTVFSPNSRRSGYADVDLLVDDQTGGAGIDLRKYEKIEAVWDIRNKGLSNVQMEFFVRSRNKWFSLGRVSPGVGKINSKYSLLPLNDTYRQSIDLIKIRVHVTSTQSSPVDKYVVNFLHSINASP